MSSQMSKPRIGIIGGSGPEAAMDLWQKILAENRRRLGSSYTGDWDAPDVTIVSVPELGYSMELESRHHEVWSTLRAAAERLAPQVDVYAIACNTLNAFEKQLRDLGLPATLLTPADAVIEALDQDPAESVALLGSRQTMDLGQWSSYGKLSELFRVEIPERGDALHDLIYAVKRSGGGSPSESRNFTTILDSLRSEVAVLACTELPLIEVPRRAKTPRLVDATEALAQSLLNWRPVKDQSGPHMITGEAADGAASVLVVYAGGTFGMRHGADGLEASPDIRHEIASLMLGAGTHDGRTISWDYVVADSVIDSAEANQDTPAILATLIRSQTQTRRWNGVVLVHGTDTLAHTAARLALELDDLHIPVACTGSQLPLGSRGTDADQNFKDSVYAATGGVSNGVWIVFGGRTLPALRGTKHSSQSPLGFIAHRSSGQNPVGVPANVLVKSRAAPSRTAVGLVKITPGLSPAVLTAAFDAHPKGLVLECYGAGNAPGYVADLARAAVDRGTVVLAVTQCAEGTVLLDKYAVGTELARAGVMSGGDLTSEAAVAKLGLLLDAGLEGEEICALLKMNLAGEREPEDSRAVRDSVGEIEVGVSSQ